MGEKFFGKIGFATNVETAPGVWTKEITEIEYRGDVSRHTQRYQQSDGANDNFTLDNEITIIADPFAQRHFPEILYVEWYGVRWKVKSIQPQYPKLIINLGGVYNVEEN